MDLIPSHNKNVTLDKPGSETRKYGMELESVFGQMLEQVGQLGQFCKQSFQKTQEDISSLQDTNETMGIALTELIQDKPRIENAIITQNSITNSIMIALKMTKDEIERIAIKELETRNYSEEQVTAMEEWRRAAEPRITISEDCTRRAKEFSEKLQGELNYIVPIIKRLSNYEVEKQDTSEEIRKLKAEITQMKKTQEFTADQDVQLLKKQVEELLDAKSELFATQLAMDSAIQTLQSQNKR